MTPALRFTAFAVLLGVVPAAQFIRPDFHNPPVDHARSIWNDSRVDPKVTAILRRACADCHSHETAWPWYSRVSPVSWMIDRHVRNGRSKLNFSDWSGPSPDQLEEIYGSVSKGKMPMSSYTLMHPEARLTPRDREILQEWADGKLAQNRGQ